MDIISHALWTGVGMTLASRRTSISPRTVSLTVGLAVVPDLLHLLPIFGWLIVGDGSFAVLRAYAVAVPGQEPALPPLVHLWSHHLHCITHSAVLASAVTLLSWAALRSLWIPLLGWWSHIVLDLFTHSADYYPVQVLYPLSNYTFNGLAWNTPWFLQLNYVLLGGAIVWLITTRRVELCGPDTNRQN
jgi:LexA-binding, inner membrane-associated putative hydrolase